MTRPHLANMDEAEGNKGDNCENINMKESATRNKRDSLGEEDEGIIEHETGSGNVGHRKKEKSMADSIPVVTIENPTPSPRPRSGREKVVDDVVEDDEEDEEEEDMDYDTGEEEEVEEEEEDMEMTPEEKQAMYESVKEGDIDAFEDCLDLPNADINMTWFRENLLMAAIRAGQTEMAEFLVDNGVDHTYTTSRMAVRETPDGIKKFDFYEMDCRQMAFEYGLDDLVYLLDYLQGRLFSFVPAPKRSPRMRRPPPPPITPTDSNIDEGNSSDADVSDTSSQQSQDELQGDDNKESAMKKRKKKKKKGKIENKSMTSDKDRCQSLGHEDDEVEEKDKTAWTGSTFTEVDSGNYSMASSKLKKGMVEKHNKLLELDLDQKDAKTNEDKRSSKTNSPRKSASGAGSEKSREKSQNEQDNNDGGQEGDEGLTGTSRSKSTSVLSPDLGPPLPEIPHPPNDLIRFNRSTLAVQKSNALRRFYTTPLNESNIDSPLMWKKICTTGSYVMESKNWHRDKNVNSTSPRSGPEQAASSGMVNLSTGNESKSIPKSPSSSRVVSATSSVTQLSSTSLQPPSSAVSLSISPSSLNSPSPSTRPPTISSRMSSAPSASILKQTQISGDKPSRFTPDPSKSNSTRPTIAGYMRPTQSTITKNRLHPRFVDSYGGLDFHHSGGRHQIFRLNLKSDKSADLKASSPSISLTQSTPKRKPNPQRRNHNTISYRS